MRAALATFALGLVMGGVIVTLVSSRVDPAIDDPAKVTVSSQAGGERRRTTKRSSAASFDLGEWKKASSSDLKNQIGDLSPEESRGILEALINGADPFEGLDYSNKKILKEILAHLAETEFDSSVLWIESTFPEVTQLSLLTELTLKYAAHDFTATLSYVGSMPDEQWREKLVPKLLGIGVKSGEADAIAALELMPIRSGGRSGWGIEFPDGFDFQQFGEAAYTLAMDGRDRGSFASFPSNFLEEWAKRSPDEAMVYYGKHLREEKRLLPFNDLSDLSEGYLSVADPEEGAEWIDEILGSEDFSKDDKNTVLGTVMEVEQQGMEIAHQLLERRETVEEVAELAGSFLDAVKGRSGGNSSTERRQILELFPDPESRISHVIERGRAYRSRRDELVRHLEGLGHSENDIARFIEATGER